MKGRRLARGGVLPLLMMAAVIISALSLVALAVCALILVNSKLRSTGENIGLQMGMVLNKNDRIGEMNLMIERARELVYSVRQNYNRISKEAPHVEPLCRLLLEDARQGAIKVEEERTALAGLIGKQAEAAALQHVEKIKSNGPINLMFFRLTQSDQITLDLGAVRDIPSNATCAVAIPGLKEHDQEEEYLFGKTNFFKSGCNARLPQPDNDLKFIFASLAPKIKETISESRLINPDDFEKQVTVIAPGLLKRPVARNLPSAIRLLTKSGVDAPLQMHEEMSTSTISTATGSCKED